MDRLGGLHAPLLQAVIEANEVEHQLHPRFRRPGDVAAVGQDGARDQLLEPRQGAGHQRLARLAGDGRAGQGGGGGALGGAPSRIARQQELARLTGQEIRQHLDLGFGGHRHQRSQGAGGVDHPAIQHLPAPGEAGPASEHQPPFLDQPQRLARAIRAHAGQVAQPAEAMQRLGEGAAGAGPVPGLAPLAHLQALAGVGEHPGHQRAAALGAGRAGVLGEDREALGPGAGQPGQMRRRAEPLGAALPRQGDEGGFEPELGLVAGHLRGHGPPVSRLGARRCCARRPRAHR